MLRFHLQIGEQTKFLYLVDSSSSCILGAQKFLHRELGQVLGRSFPYVDMVYCFQYVQCPGGQRQLADLGVLVNVDKFGYRADLLFHFLIEEGNLFLEFSYGGQGFQKFIVSDHIPFQYILFWLASKLF